MARLQAMLGSDDWAPEGSTGAQAALAQASTAITPALRTDSASSGRPPLPDSRPRSARAQAARQPENAIRARHAAQQPLAGPCTATAISQRAEPVPQARSSLPETVTLEVRPSVEKQAQEEPICLAQSPLLDVLTQEVTSSREHLPQIHNGKGSSGGAATAPAPVSVASQPLTEEGRAEFVRTLTAKIAEATQQAALGAISSSVEVCTFSL